MVATTADINGGTIDGVSIGASTPLTYLAVSPLGAAVPTASSLAIQDNSISGNIVRIMSTPASGGGNIVNLVASGTSWGSGGVLRIQSNDSNCIPFQIYSGDETRVVYISRGGSIVMDGDLQLAAGGSITTSADGNITLLPDGSGITIVGNAGSTSHSLNVNDDLFVSGRLEVAAYTYLDGVVYCADRVQKEGGVGASLAWKSISELVTIPVGSGNTPVVASTSDLAPANSIIKAVTVRVTQAPGGGATVVSVGRTNGGNTDEFIDAISTAAGTIGNHASNSDGTLTYTSMLQDAADTFDITTDADVTGSDMILRITVFYDFITDHTG